MPLPEGFINERIAHYREERDRALASIKQIEEDGWRFFMARGNETMQDVTEERAADQRRVAEMMENLITVYERDTPAR
jgi:hypothetical protein